MEKFRILVNTAGVYVKGEAFFIDQGGLREPWGKAWEPIEAVDLPTARQAGSAIRRKRFPDAGLAIGEGPPGAVDTTMSATIEACAKIAESYPDEVAKDIAAAIRAQA